MDRIDDSSDVSFGITEFLRYVRAGRRRKYASAIVAPHARRERARATRERMIRAQIAGVECAKHNEQSIRTRAYKIASQSLCWGPTCFSQKRRSHTLEKLPPGSGASAVARRTAAVAAIATPVASFHDVAVQRALATARVRHHSRHGRPRHSHRPVGGTTAVAIPP